jgi:integrase
VRISDLKLITAIVAGSEGGEPRHIALDSKQRQAAIEHSRTIIAQPDAHMGRPGESLKQSMKRFMYVMAKFGITKKALGVTAHALRHEVLIAKFEELTGQTAPVRGGAKLPKDISHPARQAVAALAGHTRLRAANAYCAGMAARKSEEDEPSK